ncbi:tape measure protein [Neisseria sp. 27098_8_139]|uniref:tape measure protein n=1 Tax=Neisseria sp. 27098_8_139 TaxID=3003681 RepID=UPI00352D3FF2
MSKPKTEIEVTVQDRASRALRTIRERFGALNNGRVGRAMAQVSRATDQATATLKHYAAAGAVLAAGAVFMVKGVVDTASEFERYRSVLETIEGSSEKARQSMAWVSEFATKTPYELSEVNEAFVKLKSYGLDPIKDGLLTTLGDTAAGMGKPLMQTVEAIADAMTGQNERLKEFGIKAEAIKGTNRIIYEYTDKHGRQMRAMADKNNREQIRATLQTIWNEKYGGAMDKLSGTFAGMMSNLSDNWERFKLMIADSGVFDYLKNKLSGLLEKIDAMAQDGSLQKLAETIGKNLVTAFEKAWEFGTKLYEKFNEINNYLGGFGNTMLVVAAILSLPLVAAFVNVAWAVGSLAVALIGALPAIWGFTAALLANPITWIIGLVAAFAGLVYVIWRNWDGIGAYFSRLWDEVSGAFAEAWELIKELCASAFEALGYLFLNFTPVGWMIQSMTAVWGYLKGVWPQIRQTFVAALSAIGGVLSGFSPINLMRGGFEALKGYISGVWDWIRGKLQWALDKLESLGNTVRSVFGGGDGAAAPGTGPAGALVGKMQNLNKVAVHIDHSNVPRGTRMQARASNGVQLSTKQGYSLAT